MRFFPRKATIPPALVEAGKRWQTKNVLNEIDVKAEVLFCIPLKAKSVSNDWEKVNHCLSFTMESLIRQTDKRWIAVVCCQDRPDCLPEDPRVTYLPYATEAKPNRMDKNNKLNSIYDYVLEMGHWDGYVFNLDADDVIHPDLVKYFLKVRSRFGYIITRGYIYDAASNILGFLQPKSFPRIWAKPFYQHCGSSSAIRLDLRDGLGFVELLRSRGKHKEQRARLAAFGIELKEVEFPAAIYMVNHGDNDQTRKGKLRGKLNYITKNRVSGDLEVKVRNAFGLKPLE